MLEILPPFLSVLERLVGGIAPEKLNAGRTACVEDREQERDSLLVGRYPLLVWGVGKGSCDRPVQMRVVKKREGQEAGSERRQPSRCAASGRHCSIPGAHVKTNPRKRDGNSGRAAWA